MKHYIFLIGLVFSLGLLSCGGNDVIFDEGAQLETDIMLIEEFLADNGLEADTLLPSGIRIITDDPGQEPKARFGDSVETRYRGYLLDGTEFDSSEGRDPLWFIVGKGDVIQGWEIAIRQLGKGGRATVFVPSQYGYGNRGQGIIPPNSVLVFEINVLNIR